jgi:hypothetical protein
MVVCMPSEETGHASDRMKARQSIFVQNINKYIDGRFSYVLLEALIDCSIT